MMTDERNYSSKLNDEITYEYWEASRQRKSRSDSAFKSAPARRSNRNAGNGRRAYAGRKSHSRRSGTISGGRVLVWLLLVITVLTVMAISTRTISAQESSIQEKYYTSYHIKRGDTLWSVAENYMTEDYDSIYSYIDEVKQINHLESDQLTAGMNICVPYYAR